MRWLVLCLVFGACQAQQEVSPDLPLVGRIKLKVAENQLRLPNYTCEQTIERSQRVAPARKFELLDTVRLEVALVEHKELYGWPGADRIAESELAKLVGGTIGNGDFGLLARGIFLSDGSIFTRIGEAELDGRKTIRFDYRVPLLSSRYHLKVPPNEALVAYHGSFWVDAGTLDLVRVDLAADDIPRYLGLRSSTKILHYRQTSMGGSTFLLPFDAELLMVDLGGTEHLNRTRFHGCRQYTGESVLSFADPPPAAPAAEKAPVAGIELPAEFLTGIALDTPIDSGTSAIGDAVEAKLIRDMKDHRRTVAPKGALLKGRITRLQRVGNFYAFELQFDSIEFPGSRAGLSGRENVLSIDGPSRTPCLPRAFGTCDSGSPARGPLQIPGRRLRLPRGFRMHLHSLLLKSEER